MTCHTESEDETPIIMLYKCTLVLNLILNLKKSCKVMFWCGGGGGGGIPLTTRIDLAQHKLPIIRPVDS